jgi:two-component system NarL family response regulator
MSPRAVGSPAALCDAARLVEASGDAFIATDFESRVTSWNAAAERIYGYAAEEVIGRSACALAIHGGDLSPMLDEGLDRTGITHTVSKARRKDGACIDVEVVTTAISGPTGAVVGRLGIHRDITERTRVEDEHRWLSALAEHSPDFIGMADIDGHVRFLNAAGRRLVGLDEVMGRKFIEFFPADERERAAAMVAEVLADGRRAAELHFERFDTGERIPVSVEGFRVDDPVTGEPGLIGTISRDLRERRRAEAELREERDRQTRRQVAIAELGAHVSRDDDLFAPIEEAAAVAYRTLDADLVVVAELLPDGKGLLSRARVGSTQDGPEAILGPRSPLAHAAESGKPVLARVIDDRWELSPADAAANAVVVPIPGRRGPFGAIGMFSPDPRAFGDEEVNFLRAIATVLFSASERTEMAQRVRNVRESDRRRIARALHDETLQELAVALGRAAQSPATQGAEDERLVTTLQRIGEQIRSAIHDLRLGDGGDRPFAARVEDLAVVHRTLDPRCEISVLVEGLPDHLPGDMATHVLRTISEALANPGRHAPATHVEVDVRVEGDHLALWVSDDGRGGESEPAAAADAQRIAGMRERAELLGGELSVSPRISGGTTVQMLAPLMSTPGTGGVRVLLVDRHAAIREAMALAFAEDDGFVVAAQAGSLAEARPALHDVDVMIVDLTLPDGYGGDLIAELRAANPDAQALVLSADVDHAATARAVEKGAAAVFSKTVHLHEVVAAVRRLRAGETLTPPDEVVELLRFAGHERVRVNDEHRLVDSLTAREREVLQLLADGLDGRGIAARLNISPRTERNHVANVLAKLGVHSQLQAVIFALRNEVVAIERDR